MSADNYNAVLHYLKVESVYYSRSSLGGDDWGVEVPAYEDTSMFHIVASGGCRVEIKDSCLTLAAGDVVFISRACGHKVMGNAGTEATDLDSLPVCRVSEFYETLELNPDAPDKTIILCGVVRIGHPSGEMLIREMPDIIHIRQQDHMFGSMIGEIARLMFREALGEFIGGETVITRLADILMIQTIRHWVEHTDDFGSSWLRALKDKKIGKALALIHSDPQRPWTIESLAGEVAMSRTAFANRFSELIGDTVINYLTRWRMNLAQLRVKNGERVDLDFVESLGYQSDAAFRRAFKKTLGVTVSELAP